MDDISSARLTRRDRRIGRQEEGGGGAFRTLLIHGREKVSISMYAHIRRNPRFTELVAKRTRFAGILAAIVLIVFYGFVLLVAFAPELIGKRLFEGSNLTFGILAGLLQFIFFWVLTLVYVRRANGEFDDINKELVKAAWKEEK